MRIVVGVAASQATSAHTRKMPPNSAALDVATPGGPGCRKSRYEQGPGVQPVAIAVCSPVPSFPENVDVTTRGASGLRGARASCHPGTSSPPRSSVRTLRRRQSIRTAARPISAAATVHQRPAAGAPRGAAVRFWVRQETTADRSRRRRATTSFRCACAMRSSSATRSRRSSQLMAVKMIERRRDGNEQRDEDVLTAKGHSDSALQYAIRLAALPAFMSFQDSPDVPRRNRSIRPPRFRQPQHRPGFGRRFMPNSFCMPLTMPRSSTGKMSGRFRRNIRNISADQRPRPLTAVMRAITSSSGWPSSACRSSRPSPTCAARVVEVGDLRAADAGGAQCVGVERATSRPASGRRCSPASVCDAAVDRVGRLARTTAAT